MEGTFWAFMPAIIAIVLALVTKQVYVSSFATCLLRLKKPNAIWVTTPGIPPKKQSKKPRSGRQKKQAFDKICFFKAGENK